jgi:glycosyltransferase involved in cell wall biosynthesis
MDKEIILIDDCSIDGTKAILQKIASSEAAVTVLFNDRNYGKGYSLRRGIMAASGDIILIQDADLEYDPSDYPKLLEPILAGKADAVFGSRFISAAPKRVFFFWHYMGNRLLTFLSNMFSNLNLSDMETCYKVFDAKLLKRIRLQENRFGFEPEVTYKVSCIKKVRIYEVGISYFGRSYEEGKKIGWKDGVRAIYVIFKYPLLRAVFGNNVVFSSIAGRIDGDKSQCGEC